MFWKYNFHENGIKMNVCIQIHTIHTFVYSGAHARIHSIHKMRRSEYNLYYFIYTHNMSIGKWPSPDPPFVPSVRNRKCTSLFLIRTFILFQYIHFNRESIWHFQWILWKEPESYKQFLLFSCCFFEMNFVQHCFCVCVCELKCENKWSSRNEFQRILNCRNLKFYTIDLSTIGSYSIFYWFVTRPHETHLVVRINGKTTAAAAAILFVQKIKILAQSVSHIAEICQKKKRREEWRNEKRTQPGQLSLSKANRSTIDWQRSSSEWIHIMPTTTIEITAEIYSSILLWWGNL